MMRRLQWDLASYGMVMALLDGQCSIAPHDLF